MYNRVSSYYNVSVNNITKAYDLFKTANITDVYKLAPDQADLVKQMFEWVYDF